MQHLCLNVVLCVDNIRSAAAYFKFWFGQDEPTWYNRGFWLAVVGVAYALVHFGAMKGVQGFFQRSAHTHSSHSWLFRRKLWFMVLLIQFFLHMLGCLVLELAASSIPANHALFSAVPFYLVCRNSLGLFMLLFTPVALLVPRTWT